MFDFKIIRDSQEISWRSALYPSPTFSQRQCFLKLRHQTQETDTGQWTGLHIWSVLGMHFFYVCVNSSVTFNHLSRFRWPLPWLRWKTSPPPETISLVLKGQFLMHVKSHTASSFASHFPFGNRARLEKTNSLSLLAVSQMLSKHFVGWTSALWVLYNLRSLCFVFSPQSLGMCMNITAEQVHESGRSPPGTRRRPWRACMPSRSPTLLRSPRP